MDLGTKGTRLCIRPQELEPNSVVWGYNQPVAAYGHYQGHLRCKVLFTNSLGPATCRHNIARPDDGTCEYIGEARWPARALGSWVRIPLEAWMCVCLFCVRVVLCVGSCLETGCTPSMNFYILNLKKRPRSTSTVEP
jgi:hypothetical protein